ncbi:hypothetical protein [Streptomyces sp. NPDC018031]|uniref:hypothetical protein n=1 Tax=Streptomyces sp. NPDC018031 TaxID=3365033 RepID=UPI0037A77DED
MLRTRWFPGPAGGANGTDGAGGHGGWDGPVVVSVTEFTSDGYRRLPGIARRGLALRRHWPHLDGALGMWLWAAPPARRCGSVSVWTGQRALARFVRLPEHVEIMDAYRGLGTMRSVTWEYGRFDMARTRRDAEAWLMPGGRRRSVPGGESGRHP